MRALAGPIWQEHGLVFPSTVGTPAEERNVLRRFQKICADNGFPKLRVYDLRHSRASLLINEGVHPKKISERLGHSSIKLTMDTYGHLFEGSDRDSAEKMEKLFGPEQLVIEGRRGRLALAPKKASQPHRTGRPPQQ
jgi:integrase